MAEQFWRALQAGDAAGVRALLAPEESWEFAVEGMGTSPQPEILIAWREQVDPNSDRLLRCT